MKALSSRVAAAVLLAGGAALTPSGARAQTQELHAGGTRLVTVDTRRLVVRLEDRCPLADFGWQPKPYASASAEMAATRAAALAPIATAFIGVLLPKIVETGLGLFTSAARQEGTARVERVKSETALPIDGYFTLVPGEQPGSIELVGRDTLPDRRRTCIVIAAVPLKKPEKPSTRGLGPEEDDWPIEDRSDAPALDDRVRYAQAATGTATDARPALKAATRDITSNQPCDLRGTLGPDLEQRRAKVWKDLGLPWEPVLYFEGRLVSSPDGSNLAIRPAYAEYSRARAEAMFAGKPVDLDIEVKFEHLPSTGMATQLSIGKLVYKSIAQTRSTWVLNESRACPQPSPWMHAVGIDSSTQSAIAAINKPIRDAEDDLISARGLKAELIELFAELGLDRRLIEAIDPARAPSETQLTAAGAAAATLIDDLARKLAIEDFSETILASKIDWLKLRLAAPPPADPTAAAGLAALAGATPELNRCWEALREELRSARTAPAAEKEIRDTLAVARMRNCVSTAKSSYENAAGRARVILAKLAPLKAAMTARQANLARVPRHSDLVGRRFMPVTMTVAVVEQAYNPGSELLLTLGKILENSSDRLVPIIADQLTEQGRAKAKAAELEREIAQNDLRKTVYERWLTVKEKKAALEALADSTDAIARSRAQTALTTAEIDYQNAQLALVKSGASPLKVE